MKYSDLKYASPYDGSEEKPFILASTIERVDCILSLLESGKLSVKQARELLCFGETDMIVEHPGDTAVIILKD